jgi:hypothetical protein
MTWFLWAVIASFCAAAMAESNRILRLEPAMLNAWRSFFAAALLAVAFPFMIWPTWGDNAPFYIVAGIDGITAAIGMIMLLRLAMRKTGRVTSMMLPIAAIGAFITWWLIAPHERPTLVEQPIPVIASVFSLLTICLALQKVRANDTSWESFMIVMPIGIVFGIVDALTQKVMGNTFGVYAHAIAYTFISLVFCAVTAWLAAVPKPAGGRPYGFFHGKLLWGGFWCGFWTAGMFLASVFALATAPNPALPGIILALTPLWLFVWNRVRGQADDASPWASVVIIIGAVGLVLSSL